MKRIFAKFLVFVIILGLAAGFSQDVRTSYADEISSGKSSDNTLIIRARDCTAVYNGLIQGEGDTTYADAADIAEKVYVEGLRSGDQLVKIDLFSQGDKPADYPIYVSGAGILYGAGNPKDSYDIVYQDGVFSIKRKDLIVTTGSASGKYDGKPLTNSDVSLSGLVNGETAFVKATGSQTNAGSSDNTYSIDWETADSNCYNLIEKLGRLVVDPLEATIAVDSASKIFGDSDPDFTGTVEGLLKEGDLGEVKFVRKGDDEAPGTYTGVLTASYENNGNYRVSEKKGDFTITGFTVTFRANGGSGSMKAATDVGGDYKLPACLFTAPDGRMFDCWEVYGKEYAERDTITVTGDTAVTAKWKKTDPGHVHDLSLVEAKEATCTEEGNEAYYTCSGCGKWFEDKSALVEITDKSSVIIKALGHKWDKGVVTKEATYTAEGIRTYTCERDSSHTKTEKIPKKERRSDDDDDDGGDGTVWTQAGSWSLDASGWHCLENGVPVRNDWRYLPYNGVSYWYFFDGNGLMKTGWLERGGSRYYLWPFSDGWMGRMVTGRQQIEGKWYYFEPAAGKDQGHLYTDTTTPDGYRVGADGARMP